MTGIRIVICPIMRKSSSSRIEYGVIIVWNAVVKPAIIFGGVVGVGVGWSTVGWWWWMIRR